MLISNVPLATAKSSASNFNSNVALVAHMVYASIQAQWTGTTHGTIQVQGSDDEGTSPQGDGVTNWDDISGKTLTPGGSSGHGMIHLTDIGYRWLRFTYTATDGTGTISAVANCKGF